MADEDLIITIDDLSEPFDTTITEPVKREEPVRLKVPGRDENGKKVARTGPTDDAVEDLRGQLTAAQQRENDANRRAQQATDAARTANAQVEQARSVVTDTRSQAIESEIASATTESASLKTALKAAWDAGDFEKATDLQEKMADVRARLYDAKRQKAEIEQEGSTVSRHEGAVREQPRQQQRQEPQTPEERRQAVLAGCTPATRAWLENHEDILDDPVRGAEAALVHQRAVKAGLRPDSPDYFRFAEKEMGYTVTKTTRQQQDNGNNGARRVVESAPVDRGGGGDSGNGGSSPMRVELTRGELENATNGTIVWNKGPGVPANMVGKPIGAKEMARRKALMTQEGRYSSPAVS